MTNKPKNKINMKTWLLGGGTILGFAFVGFMFMSPNPNKGVYQVPDGIGETELSKTSAEEPVSEEVAACKVDIPTYAEMGEGVNQLIDEFVSSSAKSQAKQRSIAAKTRWSQMQPSQIKEDIAKLASDAALNVNLGHGVLLHDILKDMTELTTMISQNERPLTSNTSANVTAIIDKMIAIQANLLAIEGVFDDQTVNGWVATESAVNTLTLIRQDFVLIQTMGYRNENCSASANVYVEGRDKENLTKTEE